MPTWTVFESREHLALGFRGIVRHQCYRALRSRPVAVSWDETLEPGNGRPDLSEYTVQNAIWEQVDHAIQALPATQQEVVRLHYKNGPSLRLRKKQAMKSSSRLISLCGISKILESGE